MLKYILAILFLGIIHAYPLDDDLVTYGAKGSQMYRKVISNFYDKDLRPPGLERTDDPAAISSTIFLNILSFCTKRQVFTVGGYFRQFWTDRRLKATENIGEKDLIIKKFHGLFGNNEIWTPDTFVVGSQKGYVQEGPVDSFLRVHADGTVKSSFRLKTELTCPVKDGSDQVTCELSFESYGFTANDVTYKWGEDEVLIAEEATKTLENQGWKVTETRQENPTVELTSGKYSSIGIVFELSRI